MRINGNVVLNSGGTSEIQNMLVERVASNPAVVLAEKGRIVFNTTDAIYYYNTGTVWQAFATGGNAAALQSEVDALEASLGGIVSAAGVWTPSALSSAANIVAAESLTDALLQLDSAVSGQDALAELVDVSFGTLVDGQVLYYDANAGEWVEHTLVLADISDVTSTAAEVNQLHLSGATNADFIKLHAVTADAAELNILDGATLTTTELNYVDGVTSAIQDQLDNKQPLDAQLTSIASLTPTADTFLVGTAGGEYTIQSAAGARTAMGVAIGTDVQAWDADLDAFAAFAPAADSTENFTINGASFTKTGLNDVIVGTGGAEGSRWTLERGATARDSLGLGDIATMDQAWFVRGDVNAASSNIGKDLSINNFKLVNVAPGTAGTDAINLNQLEAAITGLYWKQSVRAATTANIDLATGGLLTIDNVILSAGQRVLVKNQTTDSENGIYVVSAGSWTRATDMDAPAEFDGSAVLVEEGDTQAFTAWTETATVATVDTDTVTFIQFNGAAGVTAGIGLAKTGNQLDINMGAGIVELPSDEVGIDLYDNSTSALILTENATARSTNTNAKLHLLLDTTGNGKLTQSASGLKVTTNTITEAELTASVAGNGLTGGNGSALAVVSAAGTGATGGDTPANWTGVGLVTVTADAVGVNLGGDSTSAAPGNHTHKADAITFDATVSGLAATDVQTALDLVEGRVDTLETDAGDLLTEVNAIEASLGAAVATDGTFDGFSGTNYIDLASSVTNAITTLDSTIQTNATTATNTFNGQYFLYTGGAATSHTVTHNIGSQYCNVTVIDSATNEVIIPQSIVFDSPNQLTVTLNTAIALKVVVMGKYIAP